MLGASQFSSVTTCPSKIRCISLDCKHIKFLKAFHYVLGACELETTVSNLRVTFEHYLNELDNISVSINIAYEKLKFVSCADLVDAFGLSANFVPMNIRP